jgi:hypothetical protein
MTGSSEVFRNALYGLEIDFHDALFPEFMAHV